jgi:hypothetical protein
VPSTTWASTLSCGFRLALDQLALPRAGLRRVLSAGRHDAQLPHHRLLIMAKAEINWR